MRVLAQTYPPLGQVTPTKNGNVDLRAVLEVTDSQTNHTWEVSVWHSADGSNWRETQLEPLGSSSKPQCLPPRSDSISRRYYLKSLSFQESLQFTLKYRHDSDSDWTWARDEHGLGDGIIVLQRPDPPSEELEDIIGNLNPEWEASSCLSQTPKTLIWSLEAKVPRPRLTRVEDDGDISTFKDIPVGIPRDAFLR